jgi:2-phosphosulfolactate phosphatase
VSIINVAWDKKGLHSLAQDSDVVVVVDVISFTTSVSIAAARGATVFPCRWRDDVPLGRRLYGL